MKEQTKREIGFWRAWAIAVGCAIGSGIFMMPTLLAPYGFAGQLGWVAAGLGTLLVVLCLARLAKRDPKLGGPYAYVRSGMGDYAGFIVAWTYWISCVAACAGISIAFVGYLGVIYPGLLESALSSYLIASGIVWSLIILNIRSVGDSGVFQLVTTLLKIAPMILLILFGLGSTDSYIAPAINPSNLNFFSLLSTVTMLVMWSFIGLETATVPADNIIEPEKTIPRVMIASVMTIMILYLMVSIITMYLVPAEELIISTAPIALAASKVFGSGGTMLITIGALISTAGALNAIILTAGQMPLAVAKDGLIPENFGRLGKYGTPTFSLLIAGIVISALLLMNYSEGLVAAFTFMAMLSTLSTLLAYAFSSVSEFYFLREDEASPVKTRAIFLSILAFCYSIFVIWGAGVEIVAYSFLLILLGSPIFVMSKKMRVTHEAI